MKPMTLLAALLACLLLCTACAAGDGGQAEDAAETFLTAFYTANADDRYTQFCADTEAPESDAALETASDAYHAALEPLATEALLDTLKANRTLYQYDAANDGKTVAVESVELQADDGFYAFTVKVDADGAPQTYTGQVSVDAESGLVDNFHQTA